MNKHEKKHSSVYDLPLDLKSQQKAQGENLKSIAKGNLRLYHPQKNNKIEFIELLRKRINRHIASSMVACVHCGLCAKSCHYALARPLDPTMTPVYKADQIRQVFKKHIDITSRLIPWWTHARSVQCDEDLNRLKNVVFGTCSACNRCSFNCPMGVDTASLIRFTRGILTELGIVPEGMFNVSRDQWETGNQMAVSKEDYRETIAWIKEELQDEKVTTQIDIPIDKENCDFLYVINPREIKFDPRSIADAAKIFNRGGESWTLTNWGWDQTNFGLFSGDDKLGAYVAKNVYESAIRLKAKRIVISECGHGYRSTRWEGYNWADYMQDIPSESVIKTLKRYLQQGCIQVDPSKNPDPVTFHDSCNIARAGDLIEEPRWILNKICAEFREMHPNRQENFCCTGGSGLLSMSEYKPLRMEVAKIKADQLKATGAKQVCTICHNCVDGLSDVIQHYHLNMKVVQIIELFANAMVI